MAHTGPRRTTSLCAGGALFAVATICTSALAGSINTDAALTPTTGRSILRLQYTYSEADARDPIVQINSSRVKATFVYGVQDDLALFLSVPYKNVQTDKVVPRFGRIEEAHDGVGDLTLLAKYRFWKDDPAPDSTARWAVIGGLNFPSGDRHFSSRGFNPILGTAFSWRRGRARVDADLIYQFNTGRGEFRHDALRYDLAYSHRIFPAVYGLHSPVEFDAVAELNGRYQTDGSHEVFLAPGLQFITENWIVEASVQLPVIQKLAGGAAVTDYRLTLGLRFSW